MDYYTVGVCLIWGGYVSPASALCGVSRDFHAVRAGGLAPPSTFQLDADTTVIGQRLCGCWMHGWALMYVAPSEDRTLRDAPSEDRTLRDAHCFIYRNLYHYGRLLQRTTYKQREDCIMRCIHNPNHQVRQWNVLSGADVSWLLNGPLDARVFCQIDLAIDTFVFNASVELANGNIYAVEGWRNYYVYAHTTSANCANDDVAILSTDPAESADGLYWSAKLAKLLML